MLIFIPLFLEKFLFSHTKNMFKHYSFVFCSSLGINYFPGDSGSFEWVRISRKQYLNLSVLGASVFVFSVLSEAIVRKYTYTHSTSLICKSFLNPFIYILKIMSSHQHLQSQLNFTRFMLHLLPQFFQYVELTTLILGVLCAGRPYFQKSKHNSKIVVRNEWKTCPFSYSLILFREKKFMDWAQRLSQIFK